MSMEDYSLMERKGWPPSTLSAPGELLISPAPASGTLLADGESVLSLSPTLLLLCGFIFGDPGGELASFFLGLNGSIISASSSNAGAGFDLSGVQFWWLAMKRQILSASAKVLTHGGLSDTRTVTMGDGDSSYQKPMELWELDKFLDKAVEGNFKVINLSHRGLTIVTGRLENAKAAHTLLLNHNQLLMPPGELCSLRNLIELVLDNNMLTMLPSGIGSLSKLKILSASHNPLVAVPDDLANLSSLQCLWLVNCQLASVPSSLGRLKRLRQLGLRCNELSVLPAELCDLRHLTWLSLDDNLIKELPANIGGLKDLVYLSLNSNRFDEVPLIVQDLPSLVSLHMKRNNINSVSDDTIFGLSFLAHLDLRENGILKRPLEWKGLDFVVLGTVDEDTAEA